MKRMCIWMVCMLMLWGCADGSGGVLPDRGETAVVEQEPEETGAGMDDPCIVQRFADHGAKFQNRRTFQIHDIFQMVLQESTLRL